MRDSLTSANHRDFGARYAGTYGWLVKPTGNMFVYLEDVENLRIHFKVFGSDHRYHAKIDAGVEFEFVPVDHGWFNTDDEDESYLLERVPARQWKRGIAQTNTIWYSLKEPTYSNTIRFDILNQIFTSKAGYRRSITWGTALSKHFAIDKWGIMWFYREKIGVYNKAENLISLNTDLVRQELVDLLRRRGESHITVEVKLG
jgi:hypothetical protein